MFLCCRERLREDVEGREELEVVILDRISRMSYLKEAVGKEGWARESVRFEKADHRRNALTKVLTLMPLRDEGGRLSTTRSPLSISLASLSVSISVS